MAMLMNYRRIVCCFSFTVGNNYFLEEMEKKRQPNFTTEELETLASSIVTACNAMFSIQQDIASTAGSSTVTYSRCTAVC